MRSSSVARRSSSRRLISGLQRLFVAQVGIWRAAPEGKTLPQQPAGLARVGLARSGAELLELVGVERPRGHTQQVAAGRRGQRVVSERSPKPRHVDLSRLGGRSRRVLSPALADQSIRGDGLVRVQQQHGQDGSLTRAAELGRDPVNLDLEGAENAEAHSCHPGDRTTLIGQKPPGLRVLSRLCSRVAAGISLPAAEPTPRSAHRPHPAARAKGAPPCSGFLSSSPSSSPSPARPSPPRQTIRPRRPSRSEPPGSSPTAPTSHRHPPHAPTTVPTASHRAPRPNRPSSPADPTAAHSQTRSTPAPPSRPS